MRMVDTLPLAITEDLRVFCRRISNATPAFVRSAPSPGAVPSHCFDNVARRIEDSRGDLVHGWAISHFRGAYFEAEHHGLWRSPAGDLQDVSPQPNGAKQLVFLEDESAIYDPAAFRSNIIAPEPGSLFGARIAELARRRNQILDAYRAPGIKVPNLTSADDAEIRAIGMELSLLLSLVVASTGRG